VIAVAAEATPLDLNRPIVTPRQPDSRMEHSTSYPSQRAPEVHNEPRSAPSYSHSDSRSTPSYSQHSDHSSGGGSSHSSGGSSSGSSHSGEEAVHSSSGGGVAAIAVAVAATAMTAVHPNHPGFETLIIHSYLSLRVYAKKRRSKIRRFCVSRAPIAPARVSEFPTTGLIIASSLKDELQGRVIWLITIYVSGLPHWIAQANSSDTH